MKIASSVAPLMLHDVACRLGRLGAGGRFAASGDGVGRDGTTWSGKQRWGRWLGPVMVDDLTDMSGWSLYRVNNYDYTLLLVYYNAI